MKKSFSKISSVLLAVFLLFYIFYPFGPLEAAGASLFFAPSTGTYVINTDFSVAIEVNTGGDTINAVEGDLNFDAEKLEVTGISKDNSTFSLWPIEPNFSNEKGTINFGGGLIKPGFSGEKGIVCEISFKAKKVGDAQLIFSSGSVLASDGKGTNILTSIGSGSFTITPESIAPGQEGGQPSGTSTGNQISAPTPLETIDISQPFNQNLWHKNNNLIINWKLLPGSSEASIAFDKNAITDPGNSGVTTLNQEYKNTADGIWYFHIKYKTGRSWSDAAHYKIQIDASPPAPYSITVKNDLVGEWPILYFQAQDAISGIDKYVIFIDNLADKSITLESSANSYIASGLDIGKHTAIVKAIDKSDNVAYASAEFSIAPIASPLVNNYSKEIQTNGQFFMSGTAIADATINISIKKGDGADVPVGKTQSDRDGNWSFVSPSGLSDGTYVAWTEAVNSKGIRSEQSDKINFIVSPPIFARIGNFIINYFTVFASLLFMIILIVVSFVYLGRLIRRKLKKETSEVEDILHRKLEKLRQEIDRDLAELSKFKGSELFAFEKAKTKAKVKQKIKNAEEKILKEVKDVEDILK